MVVDEIAENYYGIFQRIYRQMASNRKNNVRIWAPIVLPFCIAFYILLFRSKSITPFWTNMLEEEHNAIEEVLDFGGNTALLQQRYQLNEIMRTKIGVIIGWTSADPAITIAQRLRDNMMQGECDVRCAFTDDKKLLVLAHAVVFDARYAATAVLPAHQNADQYFLLASYESPMQKRTTHALPMLPPRYFNLTMTYRTHSDIFYPYGQFDPITADTDASEQWQWQERETYIDELLKHIPIDIFGGCTKRICTEKSGCEAQEIASHKFYFAFENAICDEYVTEKFWRVKKLIVPVVLRACDYQKFPRKTYIAADQFESPAHLARYLQRLDGNITEYLEYFEWTKSYKRSNHVPYACQLCRLVHSAKRPRRIIDDVQDFWSQRDCDSGFVNKLLNKQSQDKPESDMGNF